MNKMDMTVSSQKKVEQNKLQLTLHKTFEFTSYVMGYHVYKDRWTSVKGEMLKAVVEPKNKEDKFAVSTMKDDCSNIHQNKKPEHLRKLFYTFYEPVTQTLASWKLLEKPLIKEMEKEWRFVASYIFQLRIVL